MQQPPKLIAIHGLKGSGKNLTAKMLMKYALNSDAFAFGDRLKSICSATWNVPLSSFHDEALKEKPIHGTMTPRAMMTRMQSPIKQAFGNEFFADFLRPAWANSLKNKRHLIVTDLRFPVELQVCRSLGALVIHVQRPATGLYEPSNHVSEHGLPLADIDRLLDNSRDKPYLLQQVRNVVKDLWGPAALHAYPFTSTDCIEFN